MRPEEKQNYWGNNSDDDQSSNPHEMYQPSDDQNDDTPNDNPPDNEVEIDDDNLVHWSANEYISNEKDGVWFIFFAIVVVGFIALDVFLIKSYTFSFLVAVMALSVVVLSRRPPRMLHYSMSGQGLYIGDRLYHFSEFKSFGVLSDRGQHSIMMIPVKRFSPGVTVYFPYEAGEKIVDILGARLPMQDLKLDIIDIIVQKLRL